jgi:DNA-binding response OmpR family regulator
MKTRAWRGWGGAEALEGGAVAVIEGLRILDAACVYIVDEPAQVWGMSEGLKAHGCRVVAAYSGAHALSAMRSIRPDAVILDIGLPDMDGFQVCREMRSNPLLARVPVIFLTARSDMEARVQSYASGGDDFITKPYRFLELRLRLAALLRRFPPRRHNGKIQAGELVLERQHGLALIGQRKVMLTPLECDLLECLLRRPGEVVSADELLKLWAFRGEQSDPCLVRRAIRQLRAKIERDPADPKHILTVRGFGYVLALPEHA